MLDARRSSGGVPRRRRSPPNPSRLRSWFSSCFLVVVTAALTWEFAVYVNNTFGNALVVTDLHNDDRGQQPTVAANNLSKIPHSGALKGHIDYTDYTGPSRVFPRFHHPFPCYPGEAGLMLTTPAHEGILFQRPMKTGSTTMNGIVLRLAYNRGRELGFKTCKHRSNHGNGVSYDYGRRDKSKSFLFSIIREPQARALSQAFHFDVTVGGHEPVDRFLMGRLLQNANHLNYLADLNVRSPKGFDFMTLVATQMGFNSAQLLSKFLNASSAEVNRHVDRVLKGYRKFGVNFTVNNVIENILEDYDFIAIMERMDESLVVFQMLLNLTTKEILYTRARSGGSFTQSYDPNPCKYILPTFISPGMKKFLASDEWQEHIAPDIAFLKAVHKSLDRTIDSLGRNEFNEKLISFRKALQLAAANCIGRVRTMCGAGGEIILRPNRTCYIWGEGCDHDCIDELEL